MNVSIDPRTTLLQGIPALPTSALVSTPTLAAEDASVMVYKGPARSCCGEWMKYTRKNGFDVKVREGLQSSRGIDRGGYVRAESQ